MLPHIDDDNIHLVTIKPDTEAFGLKKLQTLLDMFT
jgi:hypothetical protein